MKYWYIITCHISLPLSLLPLSLSLLPPSLLHPSLPPPLFLSLSFSPSFSFGLSLLFSSFPFRPEGAGDIRYAECSMKNGFGLRYLHKFLSIPFLQMQVIIHYMLLFTCCCLHVVVYMLLFTCCCLHVAVYMLLFTCFIYMLLFTCCCLHVVVYMFIKRIHFSSKSRYSIN